MHNRQRARNDAQKQVRRQTIINVAWHLFLKRDYAQITMAEVAQRAGLAKGTVYLYFATREELFLAVHAQQLGEWFDTLDAQLGTVATPCTAETVATLLGASLAHRPGMIRLLGLLHSVLEHHIGHETARAFKAMLRTRLTTTAALLETHLPTLAVGQGSVLMLRIYALIIGLGQLAHPAPTIDSLLSEPAMAIFVVPFESELIASVTALILGMI